MQSDSESEVWLSLVERFVRDEEAAGSNPVTSTIFFQNLYPTGYRFFSVSVRKHGDAPAGWVGTTARHQACTF